MYASIFQEDVFILLPDNSHYLLDRFPGELSLLVSREHFSMELHIFHGEQHQKYLVS